MKKKLFSILICGVLILGITGCGNNETNESNANSSSKRYDRTGLKVGDYVSYEYDEAEDYILKAEVSGYVKNQTIKQTDLHWQILYIDSETGRVDLISHTSKDEKIYFMDALGYNNGVYLLNDISANLYSNEKLGIVARSINMTDIENLYNDKGKQEKLNYGSVKYGEIKTYTGESSYYPNLYSKEIGSGIDSIETKRDGIDINDSSEITTETYSQATNNGLTTTHTSYRIDNPSSLFKDSEVYSILFKEGSYWIASRSVACKEDWVTFGMMKVQQYAQNDVYLDNQALFNSKLNVSGAGGESGIRPIVSINGDIEIVVNDGTISNMHTIK